MTREPIRDMELMGMTRAVEMISYVVKRVSVEEILLNGLLKVEENSS